MKTDFDRIYEPYPPPPPQNRKALLFAGLGLLFVACVLFGALLALINAAGL